jgi:hypothetical protein
MIRKYSAEIVLIVLTIFIIQGLFQTIIGDAYASWQFHFGAALTALLWILYFLKIKRIKTIIGIGLILGFLNIIEFTYYHLTFVFSWTPPGHIYTSVGFQPIIFFLLLFFVFTNSKRVIELIGSISSNDTEINKQSENLRVQKYQAKLKNANPEKLESIVSNPSDYQKEYVLAAQQLINNKNQ